MTVLSCWNKINFFSNASSPMWNCPYAKFGCCTMLPNRAQIGPQIRISDKGRHVHDADEPSSVIPMIMSWSHGDGSRETESCINGKI